MEVGTGWGQRCRLAAFMREWRGIEGAALEAAADAASPSAQVAQQTQQAEVAEVEGRRGPSLPPKVRQLLLCMAAAVAAAAVERRAVPRSRAVRGRRDSGHRGGSVQHTPAQHQRAPISSSKGGVEGRAAAAATRGVQAQQAGWAAQRLVQSRGSATVRQLRRRLLLVQLVQQRLQPAALLLVLPMLLLLLLLLRGACRAAGEGGVLLAAGQRAAAGHGPAVLQVQGCGRQLRGRELQVAGDVGHVAQARQGGDCRRAQGQAQVGAPVGAYAHSTPHTSGSKHERGQGGAWAGKCWMVWAAEQNRVGAVSMGPGPGASSFPPGTCALDSGMGACTT